MKLESWEEKFYDWWNNDNPMKDSISGFDIGLQGIIHDQTKTGFRRGYEAAQPKWILTIEKRPTRKDGEVRSIILYDEFYDYVSVIGLVKGEKSSRNVRYYFDKRRFGHFYESKFICTDVTKWMKFPDTDTPESK